MKMQPPIHEIICNDLVNQLHRADTPEIAYKVAEIIASLFEFTGNDQHCLALVVKELNKFAIAKLDMPLEV